MWSEMGFKQNTQAERAIESTVPSTKLLGLGIETVSKQHVAHTEQRSYSIHAESFLSMPKLSKGKKGITFYVFSR